MNIFIYFNTAASASEVLQLASTLLGVALSITALVYSLLTAISPGNIQSGDALIRSSKLRNLINRAVVASGLEGAATVSALAWTITVKADFANKEIQCAINVAVGSISLLLILLGVIFIFLGLARIRSEV